MTGKELGYGDKAVAYYVCFIILSLKELWVTKLFITKVN